LSVETDLATAKEKLEQQKATLASLTNVANMEVATTTSLTIQLRDLQTSLAASRASVGEFTEVWLQLAAKNLDREHLFGKSDPFLKFFVLNRQNSKVPEYQMQGDHVLATVRDAHWKDTNVESDVVKHSLNPEWLELRPSITQFAEGDVNRIVRICCFDSERWVHRHENNHYVIGECNTTIAALLRAPPAGSSILELPLINPDKQRKHTSYTNSGVLLVKRASLVPKRYTW